MTLVVFSYAMQQLNIFLCSMIREILVKARYASLLSIHLAHR